MTAARVAVIGAGVAGLACAQALVARGARVSVFDEGRNPGGRICTRQSEYGSFDPGAQYLTVHTHRFEVEVQRWLRAQAVAPWNGKMVAFFRGRRIEQPLAALRWVGAGGMQAIGRELAAGLDITPGIRITALQRRAGLWQVRDGSTKVFALRGFDAVVLALPAPAAAELLAGHGELAHAAAHIAYEPAWLALVALSKSAAVDYEAAFVHDDPLLGWIGRDDRKPQRPAVPGVAERWVLQATGAWSRKYQALPPEQAAQWLVRAFSARVGRGLQVRGMLSQRWRHALPARTLPQPFLWDAQQKIGLTGDWFDDPRIEGAWLSGTRLAEAMLA